MLSFIKTVKFWFSALIGVWVLIIVATLGQQRASADPVIFDLRPPFQFVQTQSPDRPLIGLPPLGRTVIMTETFGPGFNPIASLGGGTPQWRTVVNTTDTAGYYWGRVGDSAPVTFTNSAWSAVTPISDQQALTPSVSSYPTGQDAWLIYGPIDLSRYQYATLTFQYYLDADASDTLLWGAFKDSSHVYGARVGGAHNGEWITGTFAFDRSRYGDNAVYLAFAFQSQSSSGLGAFIRNVQLNAEPFYFVYAPLVLNNYPPTPTPTATSTPTITPTPTQTPIPPLYGYTFDPGNNDINLWGGEYGGYTTGYGGSCWYGQGLRTNHGSPINSLYVSNSCKFAATYASPNVYAPANFEMIVDISPWRLYGEEFYGVIFNASDNTFGSGHPTFNTNGNYYRLSLATNVGDDLVTSILLERCQGGACTALTPGYAGLQQLPANLVYGQSAYWDQIRVLRVGNNIKVFVNNVQVIDLNDGTLTGPGKFGVHIFPLEGNVTANPPYGAQMQIDFDNLRIYSR